MNRIKRTTIVGLTGVKSTTNYLVALGPNYDPSRDVVVVTVRHFVRREQGPLTGNLDAWAAAVVPQEGEA